LPESHAVPSPRGVQAVAQHDAGVPFAAPSSHDSPAASAPSPQVVAP